MKKILGSFYMVFLLSSTLLAAVKSYVDNKEIYVGDEVRYTITAIGKNPIFPDIKKIAGYRVLKITSHQGITKEYEKKTSKTYIFSPEKNVQIPVYNVKVGTKEYRTNILHVKIINPTLSKQGEDFAVSVRVDKEEVFVGEPIKVSVAFSYKSKADDTRVSRLSIGNFWIRSDGKLQLTKKDALTIETYTYIIFPQKQGDFNIPAVEASVGIASGLDKGSNMYQDPFASDNDGLKWTKYLSNTINLHVKPLPENLEVLGDFSLHVEADKSKTKANNPINFTISIKGIGNIDDIKAFAVDLNDSVAYFSEPIIVSSIKDGIYGGVFTQKIALIADSDFTFPSIEFKYFDKSLKKIIVKRSNPIVINITGGKIIENAITKYLYALLGFILAFLVMISYNFFTKKSETKKEIPIVKKIQKSKNDKELFDILLPYQNKNILLDNSLEKLEENIYNNGRNKISKKELVKYFILMQ